VAACEPPTPQYTAFDATKWCLQSSQVICDRMARCCLLADGAYDKCLAHYRAICDETQIDDRLKMKITKMDTYRASTCLAAESKRMACDETVDQLLTMNDCDPYYVFPYKKASAGDKSGLCYNFKDCVDGRCDRKLGQCGGQCQTPIPLGGGCNTMDLGCDGNSYCDSSGTTEVGQLGVCRAKLADGEPCWGSFQCISAYCSWGVCTAKINDNQPCGFEDICRRGFRCGGTAHGAGTKEDPLKGTCIPPHSAKPGGLCRSAADGIAGSGEECNYKTSWCKGATASQFGVCVAFLPLGQPCEQDVECGPAAACGGVPKVCMPLGDFGSFCNGRNECKSGLTCVGGRCHPISDVGGACKDDGDCKRYLRCDAATKQCAKQEGVKGDKCDTVIDCKAGFYCSSGKTCEPKLEGGALCSNTTVDWDEACVSNDCESGPSGYVCRQQCCYGEPEADLCLSAKKDCGTASLRDRCGALRTVTCGSCTYPKTCGGGGVQNVCGP